MSGYVTDSAIPQKGRRPARGEDAVVVETEWGASGPVSRRKSWRSTRNDGLLVIETTWDFARRWARTAVSARRDVAEPEDRAACRLFVLTQERMRATGIDGPEAAHADFVRRVDEYLIRRVEPRMQDGRYRFLDSVLDILFDLAQTPERAGEPAFDFDLVEHEEQADGKIAARSRSRRGVCGTISLRSEV